MLDMMDLIGKRRDVNVGETPPGLYAGEGGNEQYIRKLVNVGCKCNGVRCVLRVQSG